MQKLNLLSHQVYRLIVSYLRLFQGNTLLIYPLAQQDGFVVNLLLCLSSFLKAFVLHVY